jgi:Tfp pilus assembly protein PilN
MTASDQLSFLPDDYLERKVQRRTNAICAILSLVIMLAIGSAFTLTERMIHRAEKEHAIVESQYADAGRQIEQVERLQIKQRKMARQAELSASLLEKVPRSFILAEITNALPAGVSLLDFTLDSKRHVMAQAAPTAAAPSRGAPGQFADQPGRVRTAGL